MVGFALLYAQARTGFSGGRTGVTWSLCLGCWNRLALCLNIAFVSNVTLNHRNSLIVSRNLSANLHKHGLLCTCRKKTLEVVVTTMQESETYSQLLLVFSMIYAFHHRCSD